MDIPTFVKGIEFPGDYRLHELFSAEVEPPGPVVAVCGAAADSTTAVRLWAWVLEEKAPPRCADCRDLPPFWQD